MKQHPERDRGQGQRGRDRSQVKREEQGRTQSSALPAEAVARGAPRILGLKRVAWIGLIALAVRLAHFTVASKTGLYDGLFLDGKYYAEVAAAIRLGYGPGDHPYLMSPLYPYFLALFTDDHGQLNLSLVRLVQAVFGVATTVIAAWIAARVVLGAGAREVASRETLARRARAAAWITGIVGALYGPLIHLESTVLVSSLSAFFLTASVAMMLAFVDVAAERGSQRRACVFSVAAGISLGLAAALHATALAIAAAFAAVLCTRLWLRSSTPLPTRARVWIFALFVAGVAIPIAPFTLHNVLAGREPVLLSANSGVNFWIGNGAGAHGLFRTPPEYQFATDPVDKAFAEREENRKLSYREASAWWMHRAWTDIQAAPSKWIGVLVRKVGLFFHSVEIPQLGETFSWFRDRAWTLRFPIDARVLLILALCAPLIWRKARGPQAVAILLWPVLAVCVHALVIALFFVTARYRAPIMPVVIALAGIAVVESWDFFPRWLRDRPAHAWAALSGLCLVFAESYWLYDAPAAPLALQGGGGVEERHEGMRLYEAGRFAEAAQAYQSSLALNDDPVTRTNLANTLKALGRNEEAEAQYRAVLAANPRDGVAWYNLGNLLRRQMKDFRGAKDAYENAIDCAPSFAEAHFNLGAVLLDLREPEDAAAAIEAALQLASPTAAWRASAEDALTIARTQAAQRGTSDTQK